MQRSRIQQSQTMTIVVCYRPHGGAGVNAARERIRETLEELRSFLSQELVPQLSEADTKAFFIEPIIAALGWQGIGVVRREYYVQSSQEFIDYVLFGSAGTGTSPTPMLAIEAKPLGVPLSHKSAAQVVQYCAVEGIEWAALTNGRYLQFFNTFLKPDLQAKRILQLDLLGFNTDAEFDELFGQLWRLSRESITTANARVWLNQLRLDNALREIMLDPNATPIKTIRRTLADRDINASPQAIAQWFSTQLMGTPLVSVHVGVTGSDSDSAVDDRPNGKRTPIRYGVTLKDLIDAGLLEPGTRLVFSGRGRDLTHAELAADGQIVWNGERVARLSNQRFAKLLGRPTVNGWVHWYAEFPTGRKLLADIRQEFLDRRS